jgi:hypothetical protein
MTAALGKRHARNSVANRMAQAATISSDVRHEILRTQPGSNPPLLISRGCFWPGEEFYQRFGRIRCRSIAGKLTNAPLPVGWQWPEEIAQRQQVARNRARALCLAIRMRVAENGYAVTTSIR